MFDGPQFQTLSVSATDQFDRSDPAGWGSTQPTGDASPYGLFFRNWLARPLATAAQAPSSRALARAMARAGWRGGVGPVVEFGPGTGAITRALIERGVKERDLILVEQNPDFCRFLAQRFPLAVIIQDDAFSALQRLKGVFASAVLSGLPLVQFPKADRVRFVHRCLHGLSAPGARFTQFTYGCVSPVPLSARSRLTHQASKRIWLNLWPARVWSYALETGR